METKLTSPFILLKQAWSLVLKRPTITSYLLLGAIPQLLSFAISSIVGYASATTDLETTTSNLLTNTGGWGIAGLVIAGIIGLAVIILISTWYTAVLYKVYQSTATENQTDVSSHIRSAKQVILHLLITYIMVGLISTLGFLLLIIPGIMIAVRYMFAPMIAAVEDRTMKPIEESKRLVKGRFWKLVGRGILLVASYNIPFSIFQSIHPLIGTVWAVTAPVFGLYFFLVYMDFKRTAVIASQ